MKDVPQRTMFCRLFRFPQSPEALLSSATFARKVTTPRGPAAWSRVARRRDRGGSFADILRHDRYLSRLAPIFCSSGCGPLTVQYTEAYLGRVQLHCLVCQPPQVQSASGLVVPFRYATLVTVMADSFAIGRFNIQTFRCVE